MEVAADWSELFMDLLVLIVRRLDSLPGDHVRFGAVCESWRSVAIQNRCHLRQNQFPGLMVPGIKENSQTRAYLRLNHKSGFFEEDANFNKQLEVPHGCVCRGSAYGWLFSVDDELNTKLLNPFSSAEIQLPSVATLPPPLPVSNDRDKWYVHKAVFSSNPSRSFQHPLPPLVILIIYGESPTLAYCRPGDDVWTALERLRHQRYYFLDAIYCKNRFLALDADGKLMALDIGTSSNSSSSCSSSTRTDDSCEVTVTQYACIPGIVYLEDMFLVEVQGDLVALTRKVRYLDEGDNADDSYEGNDYRGAFRYGDSRTVGFTMLRFETNEKKWVGVKSLGDNVLFLGYNTSVSLSLASEYLGCIPNSIYFTNGTGGSDACEDSGHDMGIYNLTDKSISPLYSIGNQLTKPSPIWVTHVPLLD